MDQGWVCLWRKLKDKGYYKKSGYVHLWIHLLLSANHKPKEFMWNNRILIVKEGQLLTGRKQLAEETGLAESTVDDILRFFEKNGEIQQQKTTKYRVITILNWEDYQNSNNRATTEQQQADTNNNVTMITRDMGSVAPTAPSPSLSDKPTWEQWLDEQGVTADYEGEDGEGVALLVFRRNGKVIAEKRLRDEYNRLYNAPNSLKKAPRTHEKFNYDTWLVSLRNSPKKVEKIIALIWKEKGYHFDNYEKWRAQLGKDVKYARELEGYSGEEVLEAIRKCQEESAKLGYDWGASTVAKKIANVTV